MKVFSIVVCLTVLILVHFYLIYAKIEGEWPFPKLRRPPRGTHWELRPELNGKYQDMHLVDDNEGNSYGCFIAFRWGEATDYWRVASERVVSSYYKSTRPVYSPELAGYIIEERNDD